MSVAPTDGSGLNAEQAFVARWLAEGAGDPFFIAFAAGTGGAFDSFSFNGPELECIYRHVVVALNEPGTAELLQELTDMALTEPGFPSDRRWDARRTLGRLSPADRTAIAETVLSAVDECGGHVRLGLFGGHYGPVAACTYDRADHDLRIEAIALGLTDAVSDQPSLKPTPKLQDLFASCYQELAQAAETEQSLKWLTELEEQYRSYSDEVDWLAHPSTVARDPSGVVEPPPSSIALPLHEPRSTPAPDWIGIQFATTMDPTAERPGEQFVNLGVEATSPQLEELFGGWGAAYGGSWLFDELGFHISMWSPDPMHRPSDPGESVLLLWESVAYPEGRFIGEQPWYPHGDTLYDVRQVLDAMTVRQEPNERLWACVDAAGRPTLAMAFGSRTAAGLELIPVDAWIVHEAGYLQAIDPTLVSCNIQ